ncbi:Uma2 family endonuclease [Tychonema sp. LEGE 07199]|uniref:Uma2 family endonuclease n=1 Tax=unclassified Tychonema TaxID=2642144 RepID=UPI0018813973|nr:MULTISPECIES: Uma2 family endonuclease [unclassified Tychonema]MBE9122507.1 Uma2 family endonuclease [Tychonema sp. LEGE 07199]MBE9133592.1 Uma2 family endonuclease [Tychonema sp. LEGE 07196]
MTTTLPTTEQRYFTEEQYLALEETAEDKNEYLNGEIIPMTGGSTNHNRLAGNVYIALNLALPEQEYDVFIGDVRLWVPKVRLYTYPDVMVILGKPEYHNNRTDMITNPQVIVEVLSKSTKNYDRGDKFKLYKTIPSFREYILIDQTQLNVEQYSKTENKRWLYSEYDEEDTALVFNSFEVEVPLSAIYKKVNFEEVEKENNQNEV